MDRALSNLHTLKCLQHKILLSCYRYLVLAAESGILLLHFNILCFIHFFFKIVFHLLNCFPYSIAFLSCKDTRIPWCKSYTTMRQHINLDLTLENDMRLPQWKSFIRKKKKQKVKYRQSELLNGPRKILQESSSSLLPELPPVSVTATVMSVLCAINTQSVL